MSRVGVIGCSDTEKQSGGRKSGQSQTSPAGYKATRRRRNSMLEDWLFIVDGNGIYGGRRKKTEVEFQLLHSSTTYLWLETRKKEGHIEVSCMLVSILRNAQHVPFCVRDSLDDDNTKPDRSIVKVWKFVGDERYP
ncbi:hypothetical protein RUM43_008135 [Polyplax serrata]|uniref:Uncharacterized protein n=1 Tax=Polyplax serrata TaxID=468196 RepID=A0AAN8PA48_POLSC